MAPCTLQWPRKMLAPLPKPPTLPVASSRMQNARTLAVPTVCWVAPMHQISVAGFSLGEDLGDALELRVRNAGDALDLLGRPLLDLLADVVHAVDALADELLVLPAVLEDVPEHPPDHRDVGAGADAHILGGMRGGAGEARLDDDEVRPVELLALDQVLQRHRMRFRRIAAHDDHGLGVADVVVAVGHRAVAPGIGHARDRGRMADARLVVDVVGAPERGELAVEIGALVGELGGAQPVDRIRRPTSRGSP